MDVIIAAARRLDQHEVPLKQFGVQFAQIGDDPEAAEALQELDDDLAAAHGIRVRVSRLFHTCERGCLTQVAVGYG